MRPPLNAMSHELDAGTAQWYKVGVKGVTECDPQSRQQLYARLPGEMRGPQRLNGLAAFVVS